MEGSPAIANVGLIKRLMPLLIVAVTVAVSGCGSGTGLTSVPPVEGASQPPAGGAGAPGQTAALPGPVDVVLDDAIIATDEPYAPPAGYTDLLLRFALTNTTNAPLASRQSLNLGVTVVSGEGYKYDGGPISVPASTIPAGFRLPVTVKVTVAQTAHNLQAVVTSTDPSCNGCSVKFPIPDNLSTTNKPFAPQYPGQRTALGASIVDGPVTYTITSGYLANYCSNGIGGMIVNLKVKVQNAYGYDVQAAFDTTLFDANGGAYPIEGAIRGAGGPGPVAPGVTTTFSTDYEVGQNLATCDTVPIYPPYVLVVHLFSFQAPDGSVAGTESWVIVDVPTPSVTCNLFEGACNN
jgi:hypothetical protein